MAKDNRKKMTFTQKCEAVRSVLVTALYTKSAHEIGKDIGFANGVPVYKALQKLQEEGVINCIIRDYLGEPTAYWYAIENEHLKVRS